MEALKEREQRDIWSDDLDRGEQGMKEDITRIEEQMKEGFAAVDKRFDRVDAQFEKVEGETKEGFAAVDKRFDKVDKRFDKVEGEMKDGFEKADQKREAGFAELRAANERLYRMLFGGMVVIVAALIGVPALGG